MCQLATCKNKVQQPTTGRPRKYCSRGCAVLAASQARPRVGVHSLLCECCSEAFTSSRAHAKYCSARCRVAHSRKPTLPSALTSASRWVRWKYVRRGGKATKMPLTMMGNCASSTDPRTWAAYSDAKSSTVGDGMGFVLSTSDDIYCIDLDGCLDGTPSPLAARIMAISKTTYTEVSPSGKGLHLFFRGECDKATVRHADGVEVYASKRFLCMTGKSVGASEIANMDISEILI